VKKVGGEKGGEGKEEENGEVQEEVEGGEEESNPAKHVLHHAVSNKTKNVTDDRTVSGVMSLCGTQEMCCC
jgi:hypothetical protein